MNTDNKSLGIAVIGCGYWGGNYVRLFSELPETHVVAVCDQRIESLKKIQKRYPDVAVTLSVDDLLEMDGIDAVVVCVHADAHYRVTRQCIEAGKHVLLEKPMTTAMEDADHLIELADTQNITLLIGHIYLYNAGINKLKSYVDNGEMGQLYYLYSRRTNLGPIRQDVNAIWDLATHDVAILNYLLGCPPEWVSAVGHKALRNGREDVGFLVLSYPNNVVGHIHVSWADPDKVREIVAVGSDRRVVFNDLNPQEPVRIFEKGVSAAPFEPNNFAEHQVSIRNGDIISPYVALTEPLKEQCLHFLDCIAMNKPPLSDGRNGVDVVRVMVALNESMKRRGAPVELSVGEKNGRYQYANANPLH